MRAHHVKLMSPQASTPQPGAKTRQKHNTTHTSEAQGGSYDNHRPIPRAESEEGGGAVPTGSRDIITV